MNSERWQQIDDLYHAALERAPGQRSVFLAEYCKGDDELRREVESLLIEAATASGLIDQPTRTVIFSGLPSRVLTGNTGNSTPLG